MTKEPGVFTLNSNHCIYLEPSAQVTMSIEPPKIAVIFGVTGQDGYYLADELLQEGYVVIGVKRRSSVSNTRTSESAGHG